MWPVNSPHKGPVTRKMFPCDDVFMWPMTQQRTSNEERLSMAWPWWRHRMETFSTLLPLKGINRSPVNSPHKGQWRRAVMFSLIWAWTNSWASIRDAGDLRRHRAHYDLTVMVFMVTSRTLLDTPQPSTWSMKGALLKVSMKTCSEVALGRVLDRRRTRYEICDYESHHHQFLGNF